MVNLYEFHFNKEKFKNNSLFDQQVEYATFEFNYLLGTKCSARYFIYKLSQQISHNNQER